MIGIRLARARAAAGLSLRALAEQVGVSANMIKKYEHNQSMPSSDKLVALSRALNVRGDYLLRPDRGLQLQAVEFRKRASTTKRVIKQVEADVLHQAESWLELADIWPGFPVAPFELPACVPQRIDSYDQLEELAEDLRQEWDLGLNPLPELVDLLEAQGILVISTAVDASRSLDGLQASVADRPVIVIAAEQPGDRQRLTLAHELGHLLLAARLAPELDEEKACNRFAGAFLLPAPQVREHLGSSRRQLEAQELLLLKQEYGLSMQACIFRAQNAGVISPASATSMFRQFSIRGWRKQEPGEVPREQSVLFSRLVYRALGEGVIGESKAAELLGMSMVALRRARELKPDREASNQ